MYPALMLRTNSKRGVPFLYFFLFWCGTCSLRMPALKPASQAGSMCNPREGTSVVLCNTNVMVCVVCSCVVVAQPLLIERCVGLREGSGPGNGETLCHDIYPARPITTVSLAAITYCMVDGHSSSAPRQSPEFNLEAYTTIT